MLKRQIIPLTGFRLWFQYLTLSGGRTEARKISQFRMGKQVKYCPAEVKVGEVSLSLRTLRLVGAEVDFLQLV